MSKQEWHSIIQQAARSHYNNDFVSWKSAAALISDDERVELFIFLGKYGELFKEKGPIYRLKDLLISKLSRWFFKYLFNNGLKYIYIQCIVNHIRLML